MKVQKQSGWRLMRPLGLAMLAVPALVHANADVEKNMANPATLRRVRDAAVAQSSVTQALAKRLRRLEEVVAEAEDEAATGVGSGAW